MRLTAVLFASCGAIALFAISGEAQWGNMVPKTHFGSPPACPQGSAYVDGCAAAPAATVPAKRSPWNVASMDYGVGVPTGTVLRTGMPTLMLNSGGTAPYASGSGTATLTFNPLAVTAVNLPGGATVKDSVGNTANLPAAIQIFADFTINSPTITLSSVPSTGTVGAPISFSFAYTSAAPTGMTCVWNPGAVAGATVTVTSFSASSGSGSGNCPPPSSIGRYTLKVAGTGPNTASATAGNTTAFTGGGGGACPRGTTYPDGCSGAQASGSVQHNNFFTGYTSVSYAYRPAWNVAGVDYPVGYSGSLSDASTATLPACASRYGSGSGPYAISVDTAPCTLTHLDFSAKNGICVTDNASGSGAVTFDNDYFGWGTNCNSIGGALLTVNGTAPVVVQYSQFTGSQVGVGGNLQALMQTTGTAPPTIDVHYSAFIDTDQADIELEAQTTLTVSFNYAEGLGCCGAHGDWVIPFWPATGVYNDSFNTIYSGGTHSHATTMCYVVAGQIGTVGTISGYCKNNTMVSNGTTTPTVSFLMESSGSIVNSFTVTNNWLDKTNSYGYYTDQPGSTFNGPITCTGNKDLITGATATGTFLGRTCN